MTAWLDEDATTRLLSRPGPAIAPHLLGALIEHQCEEGLVRVRLTEVEAYNGADDPGSHAYRGRTPRTAVMFGPAAHLYCYLSYGMHVCCNVVAGADGEASAVLLRAGEVVAGKDLARRRRTRPGGRVPTDRDLARGPGRLTSALGLRIEHNGVDLTRGPVRLRLPAVPSPSSGVDTGPRVGVSGPGGDGRTFPWRFWTQGDPSVSPYRPGRTRTVSSE
ncbi:MAG: DNA-3-methyladenine glycosylase [Actinomycetales bacterium]